MRSHLNQALAVCLAALLVGTPAVAEAGRLTGKASASLRAAAALSPTTASTETERGDIYFVPDVVAQFKALALRPDGLAFGIGSSPNPELRKHYQGMARTHGPGTPYLFVTRSGNDTICVDCENGAGNLLIVKMGSRDGTGERLRSNRLIRDWTPYVTGPDGEPVFVGNTLVSWTKPPDPRDTTVGFISFDGKNGWPGYQHPGGVQLVGDVLAVPLETPASSADPDNLIVFLDVSDPESPSMTSSFSPPPSSDYSAGLLGLTPVVNPSGEGVRYLMLTTGGANHEVRLYRSLPTGPDGATDLKSPHVGWELLQTRSEAQLESCFNGKDWPVGRDGFQSLNFVREGSLDGNLYVVGGRNTGVGGDGPDHLDLYRVNVDSQGYPDRCLLTPSASKQVSSYPFNGHGDSAALSAATGTYVSPSGELIIYGTEYENDGPYELEEDRQPGPRTVRFGEWRHRDMVRPDSPTLRPSVEVAPGPFEVDEGGAVTLVGRGRGPVTKAWLQLFEDDGAGLSLNSYAGDDDWLAVDYDDWDKDHFDNLSKFDSTTGTSFNNNAGSWRWFAPVGCTLRVNNFAFGATGFPGNRSKTLLGEGIVRHKSDLNSVPDDNGQGNMDDEISSVQFFPVGEDEFPDCRAYYGAQIGVAWDFDLDGKYETVGQSVPFSAAALDGPAERALGVRAQHPTDPTELGHSPAAGVAVRIRNVAPRIDKFDLVDPIGLRTGTDVPFAIVNIEYAAQGSFTDPGRPDHQAATLYLGGGVLLPSSEFDSYNDAFGGAAGRLLQRHSYSAPGTYALRLEVVDDDGGRTTAQFSVTVVTPAEALQSLVAELETGAAAAGNSRVRAALYAALHNLVSNNDPAKNGALDKLAKEDLAAALVKIKAAIDALGQAGFEGGGDLRRVKYLLGLAGESVAQGAYVEAVSAAGSPGTGQAAQLQRIRQSLTDGHALLVSGDYLSAVDLFKEATVRSMSFN